MLSVYTRHNPDCKYASDKQWRRCNCPKWIWGSLAGKFLRRSAKTHSWEQAEEFRLRMQETAAHSCDNTPEETTGLPHITEPARRPTVSIEVLPPTPQKPRVTIERSVEAYLADGALRANANRAWLLAFLTIPVALVAIGFAIFVRMQPPTVIRIGPNGDASVLGKPAKGAVSDLTTGGTDEFLDEAFVKRFLTSYLNYSPADVDDHWAASLNMMTRNLRAYTLKAMGDDDTRGKIDDGQIQSVFHLREIDPVSGEPLTYLVYGVKDVHHLSNGNETTDHFVNEYRVRLIADKRSDVNPDGLWIADYSERPIDGERRDRILNAPDATLDSDTVPNKGGQ